MFDTTFSHASATPLPATIDLDLALATLHDFEIVVKLSPDCRGCRPIQPPASKNTKPKTNGAAVNDNMPNGVGPGQIWYYEVEDDLPFIPKRLWSGGVRYQADFLPVEDGCDITVHAPGGFTSTNHWRILRETVPEEHEPILDRVQSKDLLHAESTGTGCYIQIVSDARCSKTFAGFVKGFLKNSQIQLENAFIERLQATREQRVRSSTLSRRRSSVF